MSADGAARRPYLYEPNFSSPLKGDFHQVKPIMRVETLFRAAAVNAKNAAHRQAVFAHPFAGEVAAEPFARRAHPSPVFIIRNGRPRPPRLRRVEDSQLTRPFVKSRGDIAFERRIIHGGTR